MTKDIVARLTEKGLKVAFAESLTGGALAAAIVAVPGASAVLDEAMVTYSNTAKVARLGVLQATLDAHGAVSAQCAAEMAAGIAKATGADIGVATTGIAGPDGATPTKPVGLVFIGIWHGGIAASHKFTFSGERGEVIAQTVEEALKLLHNELEV